MRDLDETLTSLGAKLDALELTDDEHNALMTIFDVAYAYNHNEQDEVTGFAISTPTFRNYVPTFNTVVSLRFKEPSTPNLDTTAIQRNWSSIPPPMP